MLLAVNTAKSTNSRKTQLASNTIQISNAKDIGREESNVHGTTIACNRWSSFGTWSDKQFHGSAEYGAIFAERKTDCRSRCCSLHFPHSEIPILVNSSTTSSLEPCLMKRTIQLPPKSARLRNINSICTLLWSKVTIFLEIVCVSLPPTAYSTTVLRRSRSGGKLYLCYYAERVEELRNGPTDVAYFICSVSHGSQLLIKD